MELNNLSDLLIEHLQDLYDAEGQLLKAIPKMAKAASSEELREALLHHLEETKHQVARLEEIAEALNIKLMGQKCRGMEGILKEADELLSVRAHPNVMDAAIISSAQRVEHYEMAGYGAARAFAEQLGHREAAQLLQETLDEESNADETLTAIAEDSVNEKAAEHEEKSNAAQL